MDTPVPFASHTLCHVLGSADLARMLIPQNRVFVCVRACKDIRKGVKNAWLAVKIKAKPDASFASIPDYLLNLHRWALVVHLDLGRNLIGGR